MEAAAAAEGSDGEVVAVPPVALEVESRVDDVWIEATAFGPPDGDAADLLVSRFARRSGLAHRFGQDLVGGLDPVEGR